MVAVAPIGFSLTPGGLLLPYHIGALDALKHYGWFTTTTGQSVPVAGSSAGAIAAATHACMIDSKTVLDATIDISDTCASLGGARGRLLPLLRVELERNIDDEVFERFTAGQQGAEGQGGNRATQSTLLIAYREIFPTNRPILQTTFKRREELIDAVCYSSQFPFFATNWPAALATPSIPDDNTNENESSSATGLPRFVVDGFFAVPRSRFGCPDFARAGINVGRTVAISVFPRTAIGLRAFAQRDCISPVLSNDDPMSHLQRLFRIATKPSSREELTSLYKDGYSDAEIWCQNEHLGGT